MYTHKTDHSLIVMSLMGATEARKGQKSEDISSIREKLIYGGRRSSGHLDQCAGKLATLANYC